MKRVPACTMMNINMSSLLLLLAFASVCLGKDKVYDMNIHTCQVDEDRLTCPWRGFHARMAVSSKLVV